jgi:menaquinone-specific isochorismate synthase
VTDSAAAALVWAHGDRTLVGGGRLLRLDPGVGEERYRRALDALRSSGAEVAFASFTFDPEASGSVVVIPERVDHSPSPGTLLAENGHGRVISDGADAWKRAMGRALEAVEKGTVEKVVLARQVDVEFRSRPDPVRVAWTLQARQPGCYTFLVHGLVGSSPELLLSLNEGRVASLSLAGTAAATGGTLASKKIDLEHRLAAESVERGLNGLVTGLEQRAEIVEVAELRHRATRFVATAEDGTTFADLLAALHPTAAVAGTPRKESLELIRAIEDRPRGRYSSAYPVQDAPGLAINLPVDGNPNHPPSSLTKGRGDDPGHLAGGGDLGIAQTVELGQLG